MGRQLASYDDISYTYNEDGIRTSKTVNGERTYYYVDGTLLFEQTIGNDYGLHFFYDRNSETMILHKAIDAALCIFFT